MMPGHSHGERIDSGLFVALSRELLRGGYSIRFRADGTSMQPAVMDGDRIVVAPVETGDIDRGGIYLCAQGSRPIAHRLVEVRADDGGDAAFVMRGDAKAGTDAPLGRADVLGRVVAVERRSGISTLIAASAGLIRRLIGAAAPRAI